MVDLASGRAPAASAGSAESDTAHAGSTASIPGLPIASTPDRRRARWVPMVLFLGFALVPVAVLATGESFWLSLAARVMIFAMVAVSLDLILGYGALVSFGHAAYLGIGVYAVGILAHHGQFEVWIGFPAAILGSALFAFLTGLICLRTRGVYFIMITLAFGQMAYFIATSLSMYGGDDGLTIWGRSEVLGRRWLENDLIFYYVVFGCLLGVYLLCRSIVASRFGRMLRGCKENERRMQAIGVSPFAYRLVAFTIAGGIAGLAGALMANHAEFVSPAYMSWQRSGELIVMVVLGGMASLHGAILGAVAFLMLEEWLSQVTQHWKIVFGPLLILVVLFARGGILSLLEGRRHDV